MFEMVELVDQTDQLVDLAGLLVGEHLGKVGIGGLLELEQLGLVGPAFLVEIL